MQELEPFRPLFPATLSSQLHPTFQLHQTSSFSFIISLFLAWIYLPIYFLNIKNILVQGRGMKAESSKMIKPEMSTIYNVQSSWNVSVFFCTCIFLSLNISPSFLSCLNYLNSLLSSSSGRYFLWSLSLFIIQEILNILSSILSYTFYIWLCTYIKHLFTYLFIPHQTMNFV